MNVIKKKESKESTHWQNAGERFIKVTHSGGGSLKKYYKKKNCPFHHN